MRTSKNSGWIRLAAMGLVFVMASPAAFAKTDAKPQAGNADADSALEYPELNVTPRASERVEIEAKREQESAWTTHIPIQISALTTLTAGILQFGSADPSKDPDNYSAIAGLAVGGGWLATTALLSAMYHPYASAVNEVKALPNQSRRDQLTRERAAESRIEAAASLARKLNWLSVISNLGASGYMLSKAEKNSMGIVASAAAAAAAFSPLVFQYHWQTVAKEQREYKKRIYAPLTMGGGMMIEPGTGKAAPGVLLSLRF